MKPPSLLSIPHHVLGDIVICVATPDDLAYIDSLQRTFVNNVGFVPRTAIADHLDRRSYHLLKINSQPTGYAMHAGGTRKPLRLIQVAISDDAWRHGLGSTLIHLALHRARNSVQPGMTATVRDALPMNQVVTATGAKITGRDTTPTARRRDRIHYAWSRTPTHPRDSAPEPTKEQRCEECTLRLGEKPAAGDP